MYIMVYHVYKVQKNKTLLLVLNKFTLKRGLATQSFRVSCGFDSGCNCVLVGACRCGHALM